MSLTLEVITSRLQDPTITPNELSEFHLWLSAQYGMLSMKLADIDIRKNHFLDAIRDEVSSDSQAKVKWHLTPEGQDDIRFSRTLKAIEKMMSGIKKRIEVLNEEAHNTY